jgi:hypothetical protein
VTMHDFIQNLSFAPFPFGSSSGGHTAGAVPGRLTTAATGEPLRAVLRSFNEIPAFRPSPRRKARKSRIENQKSKILP